MASLVALMTASGIDQARRIAAVLVEERLAACCNIVPAVESLYRWEGKFEHTIEALVIIKTTDERFDGVKARIRELHEYDVPELIALPVVDGLAPYLAWLGQSVAG
jgi:periplasmic divalent cation tolerance protein